MSHTLHRHGVQFDRGFIIVDEITRCDILCDCNNRGSSTRSSKSHGGYSDNRRDLREEMIVSPYCQSATTSFRRRVIDFRSLYRDTAGHSIEKRGIKCEKGGARERGKTSTTLPLEVTSRYCSQVRTRSTIPTRPKDSARRTLARKLSQSRDRR